MNPQNTNQEPSPSTPDTSQDQPNNILASDQKEKPPDFRPFTGRMLIQVTIVMLIVIALIFYLVNKKLESTKTNLLLTQQLAQYTLLI